MRGFTFTVEELMAESPIEELLRKAAKRTSGPHSGTASYIVDAEFSCGGGGAGSRNDTGGSPGQLELTLPEGFSINHEPLPTFDQQRPPIAEQWKKEGRCPRCEELGPFDPRTFHMICPTHGPY